MVSFSDSNTSFIPNLEAIYHYLEIKCFDDFFIAGVDPRKYTDSLMELRLTA